MNIGLREREGLMIILLIGKLNSSIFTFFQIYIPIL